MGAGRIDMDKLVNSPFGEQMILAMENFITYTDEMDPKLVAYYQRIGLKKELNDILFRHTGQTLEKIEADTDRDKFMSAKEAQEYGVVDTVLERLPANQLQTRPVS